MKVLIVSTCMPSPANHGLRISLNLSLKALIAENECYFIGMYNNEYEIDQTRKDFPALHIKRLYRHKVSNKNRFFALLRGNSPAVWSNYNRKMKNFVKNTIQTCEFDLLLFYPINAYMYFPPKCNTASILSVNDAVSMALKRRIYGNRLRVFYEKLNYKRVRYIEKNIYSNFDCIHVVSPVDKNVLLEGNPSLNVVDIPIAAPDEFFAERIEHNKVKILYCCNNADPNPIAGINEFLKAAKDFLNNEFCDITLIYQNDNVALSQTINEFENVRHVNFIENFANELLRTDIFLAFDTVGSGLKNRVLQAMAAGCCVVGTDIAMEGFQFENGVHAFCEHSIAQIVERVKTLFENADYRTKISKNARDNVKEKYVFEVVKKQWLQTVNNTTKKCNLCY